MIANSWNFSHSDMHDFHNTLSGKIETKVFRDGQKLGLIWQFELQLDFQKHDYPPENKETFRSNFPVSATGKKI